MSIGERLRQERERLGLNQTNFAAIAGATKKTLFSWEHGKTAPDGFQLARLAEEGVNVNYVLTGDREPGHVTDAAEQVLLDRYRMCGPTSKQNLIQTATLLAARVLTEADEGHVSSRLLRRIARSEAEGVVARRAGQSVVRPSSGVISVRTKSKYGYVAGRDINIGGGKQTPEK